VTSTALIDLASFDHVLDSKFPSLTGSPVSPVEKLLTFPERWSSFVSYR
jgi:hypothetical protein